MVIGRIRPSQEAHPCITAGKLLRSGRQGGQPLSLPVGVLVILLNT